MASESEEEMNRVRPRHNELVELMSTPGKIEGVPFVFVGQVLPGEMLMPVDWGVETDDDGVEWVAVAVWVRRDAMVQCGGVDEWS